MWSNTSDTRMIHLPFFCFCLSAGLTVTSSLWILNKHPDCSQPGLANCKINNCSDKRVVVQLAPTGPEWGPEHVGVTTDEHRTVPILKVIWNLKSDGGVLDLHGSEINILDESTNQTMCVQFSFNISEQLNPDRTRWTFSFDGVVAEPGHTYVVSVVNLPEPKSGDYRIRKQITFPGCGDSRIQTAQICLENGSMWEPHMTTAMSVDKEQGKLFVVVSFETAQYSEIYQVSIRNQDFHYSKNISKENGASLNVTFEFGLQQLSQCEMFLSIQPFFIRCKNDCRRHKDIINYCPYYPPRTLIIKAVVGLLVIGGFLFYFLWRASHKDSVIKSSSAAKDQPEGFQVRERKRVLVIYSVDHPLYKNIVLKLCGFLAAKCGTEVVLDLLDSARLGVLGRIQWLDWHREQIESSSDKILLLCSPGVQAKWRAMCGDKQVSLREDVHSLLGDMLTPALCLLVPHFIQSASFEKYIVAYFDDVCSEEDVPSPFNITVRYKLMKKFEELFFRILDTEMYEPGRVNHIAGLSEDEYHQCPSGRDLHDAIEAFRAYQLEHPQWFEGELLESTELEVEETMATYDHATS
ncbi:interleukin-17 receptor A [Scophthalmus maximus]|uniref:interleukin-17 receptor A n=1 Tax=Scophthalmus maximus TaxID=52904 RepID=UPI001FA8C44D|nr:interleukin-17 receptor A [Scophthalmus maximus]